MRDQVSVLPPSTERRKASIHLSKREENKEPFFNISRESRKWVVSEGKTAEKVRGVVVSSRDQRVEKKANASQSASEEKMKKEDLKEEAEEEEEAAAAEVVPEEVKQEKNDEDGDLGKDRMKNKASPSGEGVVLLQWGHRKRPRCSRVDNHNLKHSSLTDESSVLSRKTVRVKADRVSVAGPSSSVLASKGPLKTKNGVVGGREHLQPPPVTAEAHADQEEGRKRAKTLRGGASEGGKGQKGIPSEVGKRGQMHAPLHTPKQDILPPHHSKTRTSSDHNTASPDRSATAQAGGNEITPAKIELDWPKFLISLSRKEKEDDFFIIKGTKLPQRPKRRPKAVEKALHYCTPGSWLTDLTHGRYDVREKKCVKKKPRGLKAMESIDSDSESFAAVLPAHSLETTVMKAIRCTLMRDALCDVMIHLPCLQIP